VEVKVLLLLTDRVNTRSERHVNRTGIAFFNTLEI